MNPSPQPTPAQRLAWLYAHASPFGMGHLQYDRNTVTVADAEALLTNEPRAPNGHHKVDYVHGRLIKCWLAPIETGRLWDRDYGEGSYKRVMDALQKCLESGQDIDEALRPNGST